MTTDDAPTSPVKPNLWSRIRKVPVLFFDTLGLFVCAVVVHVNYLLFVYPSAEETLRLADLAGMAPERTIAVIIKDWEQETCIILGLWCVWLFVSRYRLLSSEQYLFDIDFLHLDDLAEYAEKTLAELRGRLEDASTQVPGSLLIKSTREAVDHIRMNGNFKEAKEIAYDTCELHLEVLNSQLSITKYILWAIPSIGFLGTVRGIGNALGLAGEAVEGNIAGVASSLGTAFNSTWVALFVSLILMLVSHFLQGREESLVANCKTFVAKVVDKLNGLATGDGLPTSSRANAASGPDSASGSDVASGSVT